MATYYHILGLDHSADAHQIKSAFKQLAMKYHPDRNPNDPASEEKFKRINEAYHTLSDALKKSRYDEKLGIGITAAQSEKLYRRTYTHPPRYQKPPAESYYRLDKNYFKIQGLAFLTFFIISGFCFGVVHTIYFFIEKSREKEFLANKMLLTEVYSLFNTGHVAPALDKLQALDKEKSFQYQFRIAFDSLRGVIRKQADEHYLKGEYQKSLSFYKTLNHYEIPRTQTIERMATAEYYLGNFDAALRSLKHLHNQNPNDLKLTYQIGEINLLQLQNYKEATHYFTLGKIQLKKNLVSVYGEAYEVVMNPKDVPDLYYFIFVSSAKANLELGEYEEVLKDCEWATYLRPEKEEPIALRKQVKSKK